MSKAPEGLRTRIFTAIQARGLQIFQDEMLNLKGSKALKLRFLARSGEQASFTVLA